MDTSKARAAAATVLAEVSRMEEELARLPKTEGELDELLRELAAAADDRTAHFARFPRPEGARRHYESAAAPEAVVEEDWRRCLARFDAAVSRLVAFGRSLPAKAEAA